MSKLTFHNIRIAWRNLMKYKVQNTIAVLCLAVGMVFSSLTFILTQRTWQYDKQSGGDDPRRVRIELYSQTASLRYFHGDVLRRIYDSNLPSIAFIDVHHPAISQSDCIIDHEGNRHTVFAHWEWISPEHLNYLGLRSAITGKRIPVLKPGDLIMTKGMVERTFGHDVNPIGFNIEYFGPELNPVNFGQARDSASLKPIVDVVETGDWMLVQDKLLIVTDRMKELEKNTGSVLSFLDVILAERKTAEDVRKELQEVVPEFVVSASSLDEFAGAKTKVYTLFSIVGYSVLLIGLFGFLKTQIQLFRLRQREMGLRQCMGAQREQLFALMMWEVAIVFFFVTLLTLALSALLAHYALPIIHNISDNYFYVDMTRTFSTELWICLLTFLATSVIAALSVRRVITTPLSEVAGKSHRTSTRGRSLLIILQMLVCQTFVFLVCFFASLLCFPGSVIDSKLQIPDKKDALKSCIVTDPDQWEFEFLDSLSNLQHIAGTTHMACALFRQDLPQGAQPDPVAVRGLQEDADGNRYYEYGVLLTDEHLFDLLDLDFLPLDAAHANDPGVAFLVPVFAPVERAEALCHKFGLTREGEREHRVIEKGRQAEKIGAVHLKSLDAMMLFSRTPRFVYICDTSFFLDESSLDPRVWEGFENVCQYFAVNHNLVLKAKPGEYKAAVRELTDVYQKKGRYLVTKAPVKNLYDTCLSDLHVMELLSQLIALMTIVALLCIVLTLYSSVSLDTRGRQKEVAIRKANGAGARQIMWLFGRQYVWQLVVSSILTLLLSLGIGGALYSVQADKQFFFPYICSVITITLVTLLTVGYKIYKVSKLNPAAIIKKE